MRCLRIGGLSLSGLTLPMLLDSNRAAAASRDKGSRPASFGKAKNCIILYLSGGPAQLDTFDPKPDAPEDIRGEFTHDRHHRAGRALLRTAARRRPS